MPPATVTPPGWLHRPAPLGRTVRPSPQRKAPAALGTLGACTAADCASTYLFCITFWHCAQHRDTLRLVPQDTFLAGYKRVALGETESILLRRRESIAKHKTALPHLSSFTKKAEAVSRSCNMTAVEPWIQRLRRTLDTEATAQDLK